MSAPIITTERTIIAEVLEKYKKITYLWNPTHKLYTNKNARTQGLQHLLQIWRKLEPNANLDCIKKKLNSWRAAYRREHNKVTQSMETASEPDEIHKPSLWYYDLLTFLHDECPVLQDDGDDVDLGPIAFHTEVIVEENDDEVIEDSNEEEYIDEDPITVPAKKPKKVLKCKSDDQSHKQDVSISDSQSASSFNDECSADLFGRAIRSQLKEVSKFQRCMAEKLISEIMFYAKLEQLTIGTSINLEESNS